MGAAQSTVGIQWAYSNKRQSAYATATPNVDLDQSHPFEGADIGEHVPNMSDNAAMFGKGHEFATRNQPLSWDSMFRRTFHCTSKIAGWAFAFHLGDVTSSSLGGSPTAYRHVMKYQDPDGTGYYGSGRQQAVTTIMEQLSSGVVRRFPSMQVKAIEVSGQLNDWLRLGVELQGSGAMNRVEPVSGYTFPDQADTEGALLRFAGVLFEHGVSGSTADISCDVRSFRFRTEYQYFEADGYCPGSGYLISGNADSGQVRNKLEFARRAALLEFVVNLGTDDTLLDRLEQGTELSCVVTCDGATISGANPHRWKLNVPRLKYRAVPIGVDGDRITMQVQAVLFFDSTLANPFEVTVQNTTTAYLVSS